MSALVRAKTSRSPKRRLVSEGKAKGLRRGLGRGDGTPGIPAFSHFWQNQLRYHGIRESFRLAAGKFQFLCSQEDAPMYCFDLLRRQYRWLGTSGPFEHAFDNIGNLPLQASL